MFKNCVYKYTCHWINYLPESNKSNSTRIYNSTFYFNYLFNKELI